MMLHFPKISFDLVGFDKLFPRFNSLLLIFLIIRNETRIEGVRTRSLVFESYLQSKCNKSTMFSDLRQS